MNQYMMRSSRLAVVAGVLGLAAGTGGAASAAVFNVANTADAGSWTLVTGQGFTATATSTPDPGVAAGTTVYLNQFQFFQGNPGAAIPADTRLVIMNGAYPNLSGGASTLGGYVVGISTNFIPAASTFASGTALSFAFDNVPLVYGNTYAAGLFSISGTSMTAVQLGVLTANYVETPAGSGTYLPATNYGGTNNFNNAAYFDLGAGGFYSAYGAGGDTNFFATLVTAVPEPSGLLAGVALVPMMMMRRRR